MLKFILFCATLFVFQLEATPITDLESSGPVDSSSSLILDESISITKGEGNTSQLDLGTLDISTTTLEKSDYAILEQYAEIYENIRTKQQDNIIYKFNTQQSISSSVIAFNSDLNKWKNSLISQLNSLFWFIEDNFVGKEKCLVGFDDRVAEIRAVINILDTDAYSFGVAAKFEELLIKLNNWYGEVLKLCIEPYPLLFTQLKDLELCVTAKLNALELEKQYITSMIIIETTNLKLNSTFTTDVVSARVNTLISQVYSDYSPKTCDIK